MSECPQHLQVQAYHDGEMNAAARSDFEKHLSECAACADELTRVEALSGIFVSAAPQLLSRHLSQMGEARLMRRIDQELSQSAERGFIRLAGALSGIAASIVIFGSVLLATVSAQDEMQPIASTVSWVEVSGSDVQLSADTVTPAADWYLASATARNDGSIEK